MKSKWTEIVSVRPGAPLGGRAYSLPNPAIIPHHHLAAYRVWLKWIAASTIGALGGGLIAFSIGVEDSFTAFVVITSITCAGQWMLLHRYLKNVEAWVLVSGFGAAAAQIFVISFAVTSKFVLGQLLTNTAVLDVAGLASAAFGVAGATIFLVTLLVESLGAGALVGLFQWTVLRNQVGGAGLWIVAAALGSALAAILTAVVPLVIEINQIAFIILNTGISQGLTASVTGIALVKLLRLS